MYTELVVKHYQNSVSDAVCVPIPPDLRKYVATILILRNPRFPRHFLNGYYVVFHDSVIQSVQKDRSSLSPEEVIVSLSGNTLRNWSSTPIISRQLPLKLSWHFFGWTTPPKIGTIPNEMTRDQSLVLSIRPGILDRLYAGLRCYRTQLLSNSSIVDGSEYFLTHYPAKCALVEREIILAWVDRGTSKTVAFIQYISHSNNQGEIHTLITGLSVEEGWRRRGFASALISAVISRLPSYEIWVAVMEDNSAASSLYRRYGFVERKKQWDVLSKATIL